MSQFYTVNDVIKELKISKNTLYNWEAASKIPKAKRHPMNKYRVYRKEDVEKIKKIINKGAKIVKKRGGEYERCPRFKRRCQ